MSKRAIELSTEDLAELEHAVDRLADDYQRQADDPAQEHARAFLQLKHRDALALQKKLIALLGPDYEGPAEITGEYARPSFFLMSEQDMVALGTISKALKELGQGAREMDDALEILACSDRLLEIQRRVYEVPEGS